MEIKPPTEKQNPIETPTSNGPHRRRESYDLARLLCAARSSLHAAFILILFKV